MSTMGKEQERAHEGNKWEIIYTKRKRETEKRIMYREGKNTEVR